MNDDGKYVRVGIIIACIEAFIAVIFSLILATTNIIQGATKLQSVVEQVDQENINNVDTKPAVPTDKVKDEVKNVVVNGDYVENLTTIVNEAEKNSYVLPVTLAIILGFIILIYDRHRNAKKENIERTERILKTPLSTFEEEELSKLKSKYDKES